VATLTDSQLAALTLEAGFTGESAITAVATWLAESGGRSDAYGDSGIQTSLWGPSVGVAQIRSLHRERGTGATRDELANLDPATNLRHAYEIAGGGTNFGPWSAYTNGSYRQYLDRARSAITSALAGGAGGGIQFGLPGAGVIDDILEGGGKAVTDQVAEFFGQAVEPFFTGLRRLSIVGIAVAAGLALTAVGAYKATTSGAG
jgi:hypothetical protein